MSCPVQLCTSHEGVMVHIPSVTANWYTVANGVRIIMALDWHACLVLLLLLESLFGTQYSPAQT